MQKTIVLIPLRKDSKSIRNKNFRKFYTKPLFCWCIDAILQSKIADEIWIATDSSKIEKIAETYYGNSVQIYHRLNENALDTSPTIDVVLEFLDAKKFAHKDNFILVQATSPLTSSEDFIMLKHKIIENPNSSYLACVRMKKFRWSENGMPLDYTLDNKPRRQDYKGFLVESGAFYSSTVGNILHSGKLISGKIGVIELGAEAIIDIDEPADWKIAEAYFRFIKQNGNV